MSDFDDLFCPFQAKVVAAVSMRLTRLIHAVGTLALLSFPL